MFKTILIDDEPLAISRLKRLLSHYSSVITIIDEAHNGQEGLEKIEAQKPDLIFLDIEMPLMTGFEMLSSLSYMPKVIFSTAYDQYAIRAFEENSVDYLLKPIESERLEKTIEKLKKLDDKKEDNSLNANLLQLLEQFKAKEDTQRTPAQKQTPAHSISVKSGERILFIPLTDISYFEAEDKYVFLNTTDGKQYLTNYTITSLEEKLPDHFVRVSRSSIVNSHLIKELQKYFNGKYLVVMRDTKATKVETGSTYGDNLKRLMEI
ncbi:LytTR family DNA-binding domain-containing protein [Emticicia sp. BO119]|uniref:LytR/AlgR family response regulator transcription factor n=1 Tax=Emticicia sp. BO119 TaxID=2757768 RepID=UPI0015F06483|nr:LytTR family DNA-binding domain-containing protein [Emticicia sp. BO119]MBA4852843.1 response regulator transcription factor [Emticicia sp. BO119]